MAEPSNTTALVPIDGEYLIEIKEFDAAGKSKAMSVAVPNEADFAKWSLMQRAVMLKKGPWSQKPMHEIVFAILYANNLGLDIMRGDVFSTGEGRIGISNKAKIKMALDTGMVEGIEVSIKDTGEAITVVGCPAKTDLECTVKVHVKGWKAPITRVARLSRWFKARNPNWVGNYEHMLELNTVAHACEYVPGAAQATESDEAPPLDNVAK